MKDLLLALKRVPSSKKAHYQELYKMYVYTVLQLSEEKLLGSISLSTEENIRKLKVYFNKLHL